MNVWNYDLQDMNIFNKHFITGYIRSISAQFYERMEEYFWQGTTGQTLGIFTDMPINKYSNPNEEDEQ